MSSSFSSLVDNLSEGLHNDKCKDCKSCLEYIPIKDNKNNKKQLNKNLRKDLQTHINSVIETLINLFCY